MPKSTPPAATHDGERGSPCFHFFMAVWGPAYVNSLLDVALPSLLARGNLPAFSDLSSAKFIFITSRLDEEILRSSKIVERLGNLINVTYLIFDPGLFSHYHHAMSAAHRLAAEEAAKDGAKVIVLCPDMILSSGSLSRVRQLAEDGRRAVMVPGLRLATETALPLLRCAITTPEQEILEPRTLMLFAMRHLHPQTKRFFVDSSEFTAHPVMCIWRMEPVGLLARAFHLHPLMIDFSRVGSLERLSSDTIDGAFLGHSVGNWADIHVEDDSDNLLLFTFTPLEDKLEPPKMRKFSHGPVRKFAYSHHVNPLHRQLFTHALKLHSSNIDEKWIRKVEETGLAAFDILNVTRKSPKRRTRALWSDFRVVSLSFLRRLLKGAGLWSMIQRIRGRTR